MHQPFQTRSDSLSSFHSIRLSVLQNNLKYNDVKEKEERKIQTKKRKKAGAVAALAEEDTELFEALRVLRRMIASEQKIPPYMVFSDKTLVHMSTMKPSNDEEMLEVNGVGEHKLQKYGERFFV